MIRNASKVLFHATRNRAYFKDVSILVPSSWTNVRASPSTWELYGVSYDNHLQNFETFPTSFNCRKRR